MAASGTTRPQTVDASGPADANGKGPQAEAGVAPNSNAPMAAERPLPNRPVSRLTQAVHAGEERYLSHDSLTVPIVQTSTYTFRDTAHLVNYLEEHMFWE